MSVALDAVEAAMTAHRSSMGSQRTRCCTCREKPDDPDLFGAWHREHVAQQAAAAAERAVRDAIARDIERLTPDGRRAQAFCAGMDRAARIAREGTTP